MNSVKVTSLYGDTEAGIGCHSSLVTFINTADDTTINVLLDCGWDDNLEEHILQRLKEVASTVDAIVISSSQVSTAPTTTLPHSTFVHSANTEILAGILLTFIYW